MKDVTKNPNAHVPIGEVSIENVPLHAVPDLSRIPVIIDVKNMSPKIFRDYIPNGATVAAINKVQAKPVTARSIRKDLGVDYRSHEDSVKVYRERNRSIIQIAKQIIAESSDAIRRYELAEQIVKEASEDELASPSARTKKALEIFKAGHPMPRTKARELAEERYFKSIEAKHKEFF